MKPDCPFVFIRLFIKRKIANLARWMLEYVHMAMQKCIASVLLSVAFPIGLTAQAMPVASKPAAVGATVPERDKAMEDKVAKLFETIRADAKLSPLSRIKHRDRLEQRTCTVVLTDIAPKPFAPGTSALYKTLQPELISPELKNVATMADFHFNNASAFTRYSVAVWRVRDSQTGETAYWVGVELYWGAFAEFFDEHFTDDLYGRNEWKKHIAPECRGK